MKMTITVNRDALALVLPRSERDKLKAILDLADRRHGGHVTVTVETPRKPRTTGQFSQSHHLNGHIQQIAEATGNDFGVIKSEIKYRAISKGYPILYNDITKLPVLDIYGRPIGISEADSSTTECAILIEESHQLAAELNIVLQES